MFPNTQDLSDSAASESAAAGTGKSFLFDFSAGEFVIQNGRLVETEDISVWIEKILRTEKDRFDIYADTNYGVHLEDLIIGTNYDQAFVQSELKREIEEALLTHPDITGISNFTAEKTETGIIISMEVETGDTAATFSTALG